MRYLVSFLILAAMTAFAMPASAGPLNGNSGLVIPGLGADLGLGGGLGGSGTLTGAFSIGDATDNGQTLGVGEANALAESSVRIDGGGISGHVLIDTDARAYSGAAISGPGSAWNVSGSGAIAGTGALAGGVTLGW